jgi:hypothetical protein
MVIENQEEIRVLGEELNKLYQIVEFPCSDEEEQGTRKRIVEI